MALCAIHEHYGRPGTPTDQAWIESLFGHVKAEYLHLLAICDPATLLAELAWVREHYNNVRLHAGIGYVTPNDEHHGRGEQLRKAREAGLEQARLQRIATIAPGGIPTLPDPSATCPRSPAMLANRSGISVAKSETVRGGDPGRADPQAQEAGALQALAASPPDQVHTGRLACGRGELGE
jgi:hypothetical protein